MHLTLPTFLGALAVTIGFISYVPYFRDMFAGKTKPHIFSWFIWAILGAIAAGIQFQNGAGAGSWASAASAFLAGSVALYAFRFKDTTITKVDWFYFAGAVASLILWLVVKNPTLAIIFVVLTDAFAFASTFQKSWSAPHDETLSVYYLSALKFAIPISAMSEINFITLLDPLYLVIANVSFTIFTLWRRQVLSKRLLDPVVELGKTSTKSK